MIEFEEKDPTTLVRVNDLGIVIEEFTELEAPEPGIYHDMPAEVYHKIDAASASRLKKLLQSPAHLREVILNPEETDAMRIGSAVHCRVLEPDRFGEEYAVMPHFELMPDNRTDKGLPSTSTATKYYKQAKADFELENMGRHIIDENDAAIAEAIHDSLHAIPGVSQMLSVEGPIESSIFWQDAETGVTCKSRMDKVFVFNGMRIILDLKTTLDASPDAFSKAIWSYRYDIQAAMYEDAMKTVTGDDGLKTYFLFLACEKKAPFAFRPYLLDEEAIEIGRKEKRRLLQIYADCTGRNYWPGYTTKDDIIQTINLPAWALHQFANS